MRKRIKRNNKSRGHIQTYKPAGLRGTSPHKQETSPDDTHK